MKFEYETVKCTLGLVHMKSTLLHHEIVMGGG